MSRCFYTAASGLITCTTALNVIGNNIVNASTTGYKQDRLISKTFDEFIATKIGRGSSQEIGAASHGVIADDVYTLYSQGSLTNTGKPLDLAIQGDGFFTVRTADEVTLLTRNGKFSVNKDGNIIDAAGNLVLGENGPITVGQANCNVNENGEIFVNGLSCGKLQITCPADINGLVKTGENLYSFESQDTVTFEGSIRQGYLESSNVDLVEEMSDMMAFLRSYQSCSQILKMIDKVTEKTVNDLARL